MENQKENIVTENVTKKNNIKKNKRKCKFEILGECSRINCPYIHRNGKTRIVHKISNKHEHVY